MFSIFDNLFPYERKRLTNDTDFIIHLDKSRVVSCQAHTIMTLRTSEIGLDAMLKNSVQ